MHPVQDELGFGVRLNLFLRPPFIPSASASATVYSNFEGNEHKQVTGYCEASTFLLTPYISTLFPTFLSFTHHKAFHGHSIIFYRSCF